MYAPGKLLVKFKSIPQPRYEKEIVFTVPLIKEKIIFRPAGWAIEGMKQVTFLNKELEVESISRLAETGPLAQIVRIRLRKDFDLLKVAAEYQKKEEVLAAEPDFLYRSFWLPDDPYFSASPADWFQWNLERVKMPEAWEYQPRGGAASVRVAVIDTGVAFEDYFNGTQQFVRAPELAQVPIHSPISLNSTISCDESCLFCDWRDSPIIGVHPNDDGVHGTHVAGTIFQLAGNNSHGAGMAFNVSLMPVKVLNYCGAGLISDIALGIDLAVAQGADVINLSLGGPSYSAVLETAVKGAHQAGVTVVAAAGNSFGLPVSYPAAYPETIAVGATRWDNRRSDFSDFGPELDLVAPGGQLVNDEATAFLDQNHDFLPDGIVQQTTEFTDFTRFTAVKEPDLLGLRCIAEDELYYFIDDSCGVFEGTSMAAPHVAAAAALMLSLDPSLTPDQIKEVLVQTADPAVIPDYNEAECGAGLLNVASALAAVALSPTPADSAGDVNRDGKVNLGDFGAWWPYYRAFAWPANLKPDFDNDGLAALNDSGFIFLNFGH